MQSTRNTRNSRNTRNTRNTRNVRSYNQPRSPARRNRFISFLKEVRWALYLVIGIVLAVMLFTWHATDPGWVSTLGTGVVQNQLGIVGSYISDILLYLFGFSAWWLVVLCAERLYDGYQNRLAQEDLKPRSSNQVEEPRSSPVFRILGFIVLFVGSMGLESTQLTQYGQMLPGKAGGVLGRLFSGSINDLVGYMPGIIVCLCMMLLGLSFFFDFSWFQIAEKVGNALSRCCAFITHSINDRNDRKIGEVAQVQRQEQVVAHKDVLSHGEKIKIEPQIQTFPISEQAELQVKQPGLFPPAAVIMQPQTVSPAVAQEPAEPSLLGDSHEEGQSSVTIPDSREPQETVPDNTESAETSLDKTQPQETSSESTQPQEVVSTPADVPSDSVESQKAPETVITDPRFTIDPQALANEPVKQEPALGIGTKQTMPVKPAPVKPVAPLPTTTSAPAVQTTLVKTPETVYVPVPQLPDLSLLDPPPQTIETVAESTIEYNSRLIEKKFNDFNIGVKVVAAQAGPVVTRYEIELASGVKGSQVVGLTNDLARSLGVARLRIVENIEGKTTMGIELPNPRRQNVHLSEIIGSKLFYDSPHPLTVALGKDIAGLPVIANVAKMPHLLVAGTTGSGKSVGINAMIMSILFKSTPREARFIFVDPKMVELSIYRDIPHLLAPVVTNMNHAYNALKWCREEADRRFNLFMALGYKDINRYNSKVDEAEKKGEPIANPFSADPSNPEPLQHMPYIVIVIDELADLLMSMGKKVEDEIVRIAQKARAAGLHLILATQRPSAKVLTGLIRSNAPSRICFLVPTKNDSRIVIEQNGGESLLGNGDMLFKSSGMGVAKRVHGTYVSDDEIDRVVEFLKQQGEPDYVDGVLEDKSEEASSATDTSMDNVESDPIYDEAYQVVTTMDRISISFLQRRLGIGYNRSARLLEHMERVGILSSPGKDHKRQVLVKADAAGGEEYDEFAEE